MKIPILLLLLVCKVTAYGQTKKETIDWLNSKFANSPFVMSDFEQYTRFLKIKQDGEFSVQGFSYSPDIALPTTENYTRKLIFSGNFKDLAPNSVKTSIINGKIHFFAACSKGKCITQQNQGPNDLSSYSSSEILLGVTSDAELETRGKKAFTHLITILGGKKEAF